MEYINVIKDTREELENEFNPDMAKQLLKLTLASLKLDLLMRTKRKSTNKVNPMLLRETKLLLDSLKDKGVYTREYVSCKEIVNSNIHIIQGA